MRIILLLLYYMCTHTHSLTHSLISSQEQIQQLLSELETERERMSAAGES